MRTLTIATLALAALAIPSTAQSPAAAAAEVAAAGVGSNAGAASSSSTDVCVAMDAISSLVFQQSLTTGRVRGSNVPTLQCVGNCPSDAPPLLQAHCTKQGVDDRGMPTWRCVPQFAEGSNTNGGRFGLGQVRVECEGCTKKGDPLVLKGSCALKYSLTRSGSSSSLRRRGHHSRRSSDDLASVNPVMALFWIIFMFSACLFMVMVFKKACCGSSYSKPAYATDANGNVYGQPVYPGQQGGAVHHHFGGGYGGSGLGTGLFMGYMMGDAMSRAHGGHYGGGGDYGGDSYSGGGGGGGGDDAGFDAGGWGGTDLI